MMASASMTCVTEVTVVSTCSKKPERACPKRSLRSRLDRMDLGSALLEFESQDPFPHRILSLRRCKFPMLRRLHCQPRKILARTSRIKLGRLYVACGIHMHTHVHPDCHMNRVQRLLWYVRHDFMRGLAVTGLACDGLRRRCRGYICSSDTSASLCRIGPSLRGLF